MGPLGFVLLVAGFLLCVSIVWATIGFLMMGFGLICLMIAERQRQPVSKPDTPDLTLEPASDAVPERKVRIARQQLATQLEPSFADIETDGYAATPAIPLDPSSYVADTRAPPAIETKDRPSRAAGVSERLARTPWRASPSSDFDRIRVPRAAQEPVRNEPEFENFAAPMEQEPGTALTPVLSPSMPPAVPTTMPAAPPIMVVPPPAPEPEPATEELGPETADAEPEAEDAERVVLFDDEEDLADMFSKFDLGKEPK